MGGAEISFPGRATPGTSIRMRLKIPVSAVHLNEVRFLYRAIIYIYNWRDMERVVTLNPGSRQGELSRVIYGPGAWED